MLCDACKKNDATVHLTQIVENKMQTIDLCEGCSKAKGVDDPAGFSLASLLIGLGAAQEDGQAETGTGAVCPRCGFSLSDFKKAGRLGCAACYTAFDEPLHGLLKSMHKGTKHAGKLPKSLKSSYEVSEKLQTLQEQLAIAVRKENFEQAAVLRDEINLAKEQLDHLKSK